MKNKKKFTVIVILLLAVAVFLMPYLYKKFMHDPLYSGQTTSQE